jgi:TPR repeat protein
MHMAYDVFISHSVKDKTTANAICAKLESEGIRCWIAPRDVTPGVEWGKCIIEAIKQARIMVLVFSSHANASQQIRREVERAVHHEVVILPFRVENVVPNESLEYFIGNVHWLDAPTPPLEAHLKNLAGSVNLLLGRVQSGVERTEQEAGARAERERQEKAQREAGARAERERQEKAQREAAAKAERERQEKAQREAAAKAEREKQKQATSTAALKTGLPASSSTSAAGSKSAPPTDAVPAWAKAVGWLMVLVAVGSVVFFVRSIWVDQVETWWAARADKKACESGDMQKCYDLAQDYGNGWGVSQDKAQSASLYEKSCEGGVASGCHILGDLYAEGDGVAQSSEQSASFYKRACDGGDMWGCFSLGMDYENGRGVAQSSEQARALYQQACGRGVNNACYSLRRLQN